MTELVRKLNYFYWIRNLTFVIVCQANIECLMFEKIGEQIKK